VLPRPVPPPRAAFKGEVSGIILDTLRKSTRPLTTRDVTIAMMKERGLRTDDARIERTMTQRTTACLGHWKRRGYLTASPGPGIKGALLWAIADRPVTEGAYDPPRLPGTG
jgi:hypothetical protein